MLSWKPDCTCRVVLIMLPNCGVYVVTGFAEQPHVFESQLSIYLCARTKTNPECACTRTHLPRWKPIRWEYSLSHPDTAVSGDASTGFSGWLNNLSGEVLLAGLSPAANQLPACRYKDVGGAPAFGTGSPWQEDPGAEWCCCWHQRLCVWANLWVEVRGGDWQPESCRSVFLLTSFPEPPTLSLSLPSQHYFSSCLLILLFSNTNTPTPILVCHCLTWKETHWTVYLTTIVKCNVNF